MVCVRCDGVWEAVVLAEPAAVPEAWVRLGWLCDVGWASCVVDAGTLPGTAAGSVRSSRAGREGACEVFLGEASSERMPPSGRESTVAASTEVGTDDQGTESMSACMLRSPEGRMLDVSKVCATSGAELALAAKRCRSEVKRLSRRGTPGCDAGSR